MWNTNRVLNPKGSKDYGKENGEMHPLTTE